MRTTETLAALRRSLATHELEGGVVRRVRFGHPQIDEILSGGLRLGALHEVYAGDVSHAASACGFGAGMARCLGRGKAVFWIATQFDSKEFGTPNASGFSELGIDPRQLFLLQLPNSEDGLRAAGDILACNSVGALVIQITGSFKALDLTASRRLSLAAAQKSVSAILVRIGSKPEASAAETRWLVHSATPPPDDWGAPRFDVQLLRNRHGNLGHWQLEWDCNNGFFRQPDADYLAPNYGDLAAASSNGSFAAQERRQAI
jgi:protein ImuA